MTTASFRSPRILVAGGAGFLGSHLVDRLVERGAQVWVLDNLQTGRIDNILHHLNAGRVTFIRHDVTEPVDLPVDEIYNLACAASPPLYQADPIHTARTSALGALNLLALAERHGARILQASTSEVYGDPQVHPQSESYWGHANPVGIRSCYDEGKRFAETLFMDYARHRGLDVRIARIFNTYGPRMRLDDGRVVSNFLVQALTGQPITIYGDGRQTRSFCYVDDLTDGLLRLMACTEAAARPVNLGNPGEYAVRELADQVIALTGSSSSLRYEPLPADDPRQRQPDIALAGRLLGWAPTTSLAAGLAATARDFAARLKPVLRHAAQ
jgi:UDP-glucuronate decarboxylase